MATARLTYQPINGELLVWCTRVLTDIFGICAVHRVVCGPSGPVRIFWKNSRLKPRCSTAMRAHGPLADTAVAGQFFFYLARPKGPPPCGAILAFYREGRLDLVGIRRAHSAENAMPEVARRVLPKCFRRG